MQPVVKHPKPGLFQGEPFGQKYTWNTLAFGTAPGKGQSLPDRFFRYREKQ